MTFSKEVQAGNGNISHGQIHSLYNPYKMVDTINPNSLHDSFEDVVMTAEISITLYKLPFFHKCL